MIEGFRGRLVAPGDGGYDGLRRVWNEAVTARPLLIARCADARDVALAVRHARDRGLPLTVRSGGHNFAGRALVEGGVVIDVRDLTGVDVDPARRVARIGAGLRWGQVDPALQAHGLATAGGSVSKVGVPGFTLGTGLGWLGRSHGLAGDNLLGATVVTAEGETLDVGPDSHPDLYWALRGGGGGLGVLTELRMRLFPLVRPAAGTLVHPLAGAASVISQVIEATADAPASLSWAAVLTCAPPDPFFPAEVRGRPVLLLPVFSTAGEDEHVARLRRIGRPLLDTVGPTDLCAFHTSTDEAAPDGMRWDVRSEWLTGLDGAAVEHSVSAIEEAGSPLSELLFRPLGGAIAAPDAPATPFSHRAAGHLVEVIANWADGDGAAERAWMERAWAGLRRLSAGGPDVNHLGLTEGPDRIRTAYAPQVLERLLAVRRAYDPDGAFRSVLSDVH
ncbi:FAD-binding oxidoreductase [Actinomadura parmotrematis]|uniref:FAD-binding oxidoreductase n=1 Tax=Actinomadura parmotrematis TaxID=2864039 RepID=A0ABS7G1Y1_9ACTN|nr:FAD-binding oxidoreductase [Actinomadura parmotrematis]MBW8485847.1 FAD-binding oxidoreductase [Actinomadura parmotrematis]